MESHQNSKHHNSKTVTLHRAPNFAIKTEGKHAFELDDAISIVGPYMSGRAVGSGLEFWEVKALFPSLIRVEATDRDFRDKVERFYHEFRYDVPVSKINSLGKNIGGGLILEIGLEEDNTKPLVYKDGDTLITQDAINVNDYVTYRHAMNHPMIAKNKQEMLRNPLKMWYIQDAVTDVNTEFATTKIKDDAMKLYFAKKDDDSTMRSVCEILSDLGRELDSLSNIEVSNLFRDLADKQAVQFIKVLNDDLRQVKYFIKQCLSYDILRTVGSRIVGSGDSDMEYGRDLEEAARYLSDAKNSQDVMRLKKLLSDAK